MTLVPDWIKIILSKPFLRKLNTNVVSLIKKPNTCYESYTSCIHASVKTIENNGNSSTSCQQLV